MVIACVSNWFSCFRTGRKDPSGNDGPPEEVEENQRLLHCCPPLCEKDGPNPNDLHHFPSNYIRTTKYTFLSFVPLNLFQQFCKASNIYFLLTTIISLIPGVSPIFPITTILPLFLVVGVAMLRDAMDEIIRFRTDRSANNIPALRLDPFAVPSVLTAPMVNELEEINKRELLQTIPSKELNVGDLVLLQNRQEIPADCVVICTSNVDEGTCYVETANLDGETNLKMKVAKGELQQRCRAYMEIYKETLPGVQEDKKRAGYAASSLLRGATVVCDTPSASLLKWQGRLEFLSGVREEGMEKKTGVKKEEEKEGFLLLDMDSFLLRGTVVRNVEWVIGCVLYTGVDTKMAFNLTKSKVKRGRMDKKLNMLVLWSLLVQQLVVLLLSLGSVAFRCTDGSKAMFISPFMKQPEILMWFASYCTLFVLLSVMLPISLFLSHEFCRVAQARLMENDPEMSCPMELEEKSGNHTTPVVEFHGQVMKQSQRRRGMRARTSTLHEELSQVEYIFSDKTGTLTENEMRVARVFVAGYVFDTLEEPNSLLCAIQRGQSLDRSLESCLFSSREGCNLLPTGLERNSEEMSSAPPTPPPRNAKKKESDVIAAKDMGSFDEIELSSLSGHHQHNEEEGVDKFYSPETKGEQNSSSVTGVLNTLTARNDVTNFLRLLASCNTVTISTSSANPLSIVGNIEDREWMSSNPDEVALVSMAAMNGVQLLERRNHSIMLDISALSACCTTAELLSTSTAIEVIEVLEVLPFTPERKMMSVILREKDGNIHMYTKGADSSVLERIQWPASSEELQKTKRFLEKTSTEGLRTLVCAERYFTSAEFNAWRDTWKLAKFQTGVRRERELHTASLAAESQLVFVGCTAIEDRLQDGVPEAIEFFLRSGIVVWVLTGDKQETAVNIAGNSGLFNLEKDFILRVDLYEHGGIDYDQDAGGGVDNAVNLLHDLGKRVRSRYPTTRRVALVVDGRSMELILDSPQLACAFMNLVKLIDCAICCRMTPLQKALVVLLFKNHTCLAVGDGANDVSMIQAANVGIGIIGREGSQAERASDYAVRRFRHLPRLLAVHGRYSLHRSSRLIQYSFYKNLALAFAMCFYNFYNGFTGSTVFDSWAIMLYNMVFTLLPPLVMGTIDYDLPASVLLLIPELFRRLRFPLEVRISRPKVFVWFCLSAFHGWAAYYGLQITLLDRDQLSSGLSCGMWGAGTVMMTLIVFAVTMQAACSFEVWTWLHVASILLSLLFYILFLLVYGVLPPSWNVTGYYGEPHMIFGDPLSWMCMAVLATMLLNCTLLALLLRRYYFGNVTQCVQLLSRGTRWLGGGEVRSPGTWHPA